MNETIQSKIAERLTSKAAERLLREHYQSQNQTNQELDEARNIMIDAHKELSRWDYRTKDLLQVHDARPTLVARTCALVDKAIEMFEDRRKPKAAPSKRWVLPQIGEDVRLIGSPSKDFDNCGKWTLGKLYKVKGASCMSKRYNATEATQDLDWYNKNNTFAVTLVDDSGVTFCVPLEVLEPV